MINKNINKGQYIFCILSFTIMFLRQQTLDRVLLMFKMAAECTAVSPLVHYPETLSPRVMERRRTFVILYYAPI